MKVTLEVRHGTALAWTVVGLSLEHAQALKAITITDRRLGLQTPRKGKGAQAYFPNATFLHFLLFYLSLSRESWRESNFL